MSTPRSTHIAVLAFVACHPAKPPVIPLALSASAPIAVDTGAVSQVIEQGDALYVLGGSIETIVRGGAIAARIESARPWTSGATIAAPDGDGRWVVAVDADGALWRLTTSGERESIADRLGLGGAHVAAVGGAGTTSAFVLADAIAYTTDGVHLARVPATGTGAFAVARGKLARATGDGKIEVWDLARGTRVTYGVGPAARLAFLDGDTDHPRLVAISGRELFVADATGELHRVGAPAGIHELAVRGDRLWIAAIDQLFSFDGATVVPTNVTEPRAALLGTSLTGDAWLGTPHGLVRYSVGGSHDDPAWQAQVAPVFQRVCAHCHLPGGDAGIDLSTAASWQAERDEISRRVLVTRTMPPAGTDLSDADRSALAGWLGAKR
jgi:hypothetical protein